ncbi:hypothetical protein [Streptacidiphilus sp. MAP5-3]|uniref:hypothetical protein n=1 Tax=unclassified Streptacidiphilus TaxID=2643834 RepID=UPI003517F18F
MDDAALLAHFAEHGLDFSESGALATLHHSSEPHELNTCALLRSAKVTSEAITSGVGKLTAKGLVGRPCPTSRRGAGPAHPGRLRPDRFHRP